MPGGKSQLCLSDFIAPKGSGQLDYIGAFAVTTGHGIDTYVKAFEDFHDDSQAILLKAPANRFAESFARHLHCRVHTEFWGYAANEALSNEELIREKYRGIRPAPGYPAYPDHRKKRSLWSLLNVEAATGISLTESLAIWPTALVSGFYFAHPGSRHFTLGQIGKDQLTSYSVSRNEAVDRNAHWLSPILR